MRATNKPNDLNNELPPVRNPIGARRIMVVVIIAAILCGSFANEKRTYIDMNSGAMKVVRAIGPVVYYSRIESTRFSRAVERQCAPMAANREIVSSYAPLNGTLTLSCVRMVRRRTTRAEPDFRDRAGKLR